MAHQSNIAVGGHTVPVWEFDSTAQQIDNVVAVLGAPSTPQEALAALGAAVQENELDNAYFVGGGTGYGVFPVNQRGQTSYTSQSGTPIHSIDRWRVANATLTLEPDGIRIISSAYDNNFLQVVKSWDRLVGKTVTVSILVSAISGGTAILGINNAPALEISSPGIHQTTLVLPSGVNRGISLAMQPGVEIKVAVMRLDPGDRQNIGYKKSDGTVVLLPQNLSYQQELAKCKYFFNRYNYVQGTLMGFGFANSATELGLLFKIPPMRTNPAITVSSFSNIKISQGVLSAGISPTGISSSFIDGEGNVNISFNVSGGLTPAAVYRVGLLGGYIQFNSEL